jgi:hydroxymethylpyrimidine pyrophosphatase-like HAD family hydrolase
MDVLKKCRERGILVMTASARPLRDIRTFEKSFTFDAVTATNGAVIALPDRRLEYGISAESGERILEGMLRFPDVFLSVETSGGLYSDREIPEWEPVVYTDFPKLPENVMTYKILASSGRRELYDGIGTVLTDDVYHTVSNRDLVQIMDRKATKWNGVCQMLAGFGISPCDAVYFGDDNDDIEPIRNCGLGVAVSNAIPAVLEAADCIADSNDDDGVARYIEKNILR